MMKKEEMEMAVAELKKEIYDIPNVDPSTAAETVQTVTVPESDEIIEDMTDGTDEAEIELKDIERVLKEHGLEIDDMKGFWDQFSTELKDLSTQKPLVSVLGVFLIGFLAGRMSR